MTKATGRVQIIAMATTSTIDSLAKLMQIYDPDDLLDMMGLDQDGISGQDFGRERGANPQRSDAQVKALEKLAARVTNKEPKNKHEEGDGDGVTEFDILGKPRVILFQGKVTKKSLNSVVTHHTTKRLILFNDCIVIANPHGSYLSTSETLTINTVIKLEELVFVPFIKSDDEKESSGGFELRTAERPYYIIAESESDKRIWCEEINLAVRAYMQTQKSLELTPGWQHNALRGNLFSAVYTSDLEDAVDQIQLLPSTGKGIDDLDDCGMAALHWAALGGYCVNVEALLDAGANIDALNNGLNSPLLLAAIAGNADIFIFLVERGADVSMRNLKDRDALFLIVMYANNNRSVQVMVDILIAKGLSVDLCDSSGSSPLHECASLRLPHSVDTLVSAGADVNLPHGRSGLTPLQILCSRPDPDPETVRTLLQHGAYANSLTSSKVNAMDLVMQAFSDKHNLEFRASASSVASAGVRDRGGFKISAHKPDMDMDTIAEFAMTTLPVLMEIAKHGGRFTELTLAPLRDSFIEAVQTARNQWLELAEPADFHRFVDLSMVAKGNEKWANDGNSPHCLLCVDKFTFSSRRHHCRECGILCCGACSSKKLSQQEGDKLVPQRVCDSCFNVLYSTYCTKVKDLAVLEKTKVTALREADEARRAREAEEKGAKKSLFSWGSSKSSASSGDTGSATSSPRGVASETMDALYERGEKLKETADKAAEMNEAASEFNRQTKLLLQQQREQSSIWR